MILIFGGAYQGKTDFAKEKFGLADEDIFVCQESDSIDFSKPVIANLEKAFLSLVKSKASVTDFLKANSEALKDKIVIINDISQGVVPIDSDIRAWREATGRGMLWLSKEAEQVYRVFCGIAMQIK